MIFYDEEVLLLWILTEPVVIIALVCVIAVVGWSCGRILEKYLGR